jgi:HAD superfamily hydrolase (TIGR01484 family)
MKKYKALMLDIDGTTIPNHEHGVPSQKVIEAIAKASKVIHVGVATSRPLAYAADLITQLNLSSPCVLDGGAQIYDPVTKKVVAEQPLETKDTATVWDFLKTNNYQFKYSDGSSQKQLLQETMPSKVLDFIVLALTPNQADNLITKLSHISTLALHKVSSWIEGELAVKISHATATKLHGIVTVSEMIGVKREEIIGVGDSYNDFPLLMASGLKVAMGNAVPDLKAIADYIAPSVEEDGVVDIIEKFVLQ